VFFAAASSLRPRGFRKPLLQRGQRMWTDVPKRQAYSQIWMGIYDNRGRIKNICRRKNLYEYLGAYRKRMQHVQIAPIHADLSHAHFYPRASSRFIDLGIRNELKPRIPSAFFIFPANVPL
jgi:hypothetical protein